MLQLKTVRVCGPRYWPQVIELIPEGKLVNIIYICIISNQEAIIKLFLKMVLYGCSEKPWWCPGDKNDPFNSGVLYIKRKVGACSYVDDPIGCQSLLSRSMHKVNNTPLNSPSEQDFRLVEMLSCN